MRSAALRGFTAREFVTRSRPRSLADGLPAREGSQPQGALLRYDADLLAKVSLRTHARLTAKVDPEGFEPSTFSMPLRRAPICATGPREFRDSTLFPRGVSSTGGRLVQSEACPKGGGT